MAADLDRAYLINGDDLRIALAQRQWTLTKAATPIGGGDFVGRLKMPEEVVRAILDDVAKPLDASRWPMTRGELETRLSLALEAASIMVVDKDGLDLQGGCYRADTLVTSAAGKPIFPGELASRLVRAIDAQGTDDLDAQLRVQEAECRTEGARCDREGGPCTCPALPMPPGAPGAQPIEDPELIAAQQVLDALAPLETADPAAVLRVLRWACERFDL